MTTNAEMHLLSMVATNAKLRLLPPAPGSHPVMPAKGGLH